MNVDKRKCMSSFLQYRTLVDQNACFQEGVLPELFSDAHMSKTPIHSADELGEALSKTIKDACGQGKTALALSGGIDSAVLAKYFDKGATAYTFQCIVPGIQVTNEVPIATQYAKKNELNHKVVEVYWEDFEKYAPILMRHKGAPIHSIEVQIYKAALQAKEDGFDTIVFGESADLNYGGLSDLLSRDWTIGEFINRYSYVLPYMVLKDSQLITEPITRYGKSGYVDVFEFCRGFFLNEAMGSYTNACNCAGIKLVCPYVETYMDLPLDYERVRSGQNKYLIRDLFAKLYPGFEQPCKLPMPRPTNEWFKDWSGPVRAEFWPHCTDHMTGDQKWMVWALEKFLDLLDE